VADNGRGPRVSVIVPVFNAGTFLTRALDSIEAQSYRDFEVVVVDDGSTDARTRALLDAAAGRPGVSLHRTRTGVRPAPAISPSSTPRRLHPAARRRRLARADIPRLHRARPRG